MRIIIAGGGTGGHLYPGIAIAEELKKRDMDNEILFVGTPYGIEQKVLPKEGYQLRMIDVKGIVGVGIREKMKALTKLPMAFYRSYCIIKDFKPDVVVGVGGYSSGPAVQVACLLGIPTLIHEQNSIPGLTNRILGRFVDAVAISFPVSASFFSTKKVTFTGNPTRKIFRTISKEEALRKMDIDEGLSVVFVVGGSKGAHRINCLMVEAAEYLSHAKNHLQIIHQTGDKDYSWVVAEYNKKGFKSAVFPFIEDIASAYAVADLVIARAGASTISEIIISGKPSILIPYPYAVSNHQEINARVLSDAGASDVILEKDIDVKKFAEKLLSLIQDKKKLEDMSNKASMLGKGDAAEKVVDLVYRIRGFKKSSGQYVQED